MRKPMHPYSPIILNLMLGYTYMLLDIFEIKHFTDGISINKQYLSSSEIGIFHIKIPFDYF